MPHKIGVSHFWVPCLKPFLKEPLKFVSVELKGGDVGCFAFFGKSNKTP